MDLSRCLLDFTLCPKDTKLVDYFPELSAFKEFVEAEENHIKVAIATADIESPFTKMKERESMLKSLFAFLKIEIQTEEEKVFFNQVLEYKHVSVLNCFARYLQILHDIDWTEYQTTKQTHDVLTLEANRPKEENENIDKYVARKVSIQKHLNTIGKQVKELEARIFPESRAAREVALNEVKKIKTYAESYAVSNTFI